MQMWGCAEHMCRGTMCVMVVRVPCMIMGGGIWLVSWGVGAVMVVRLICGYMHVWGVARSVCGRPRRVVVVIIPGVVMGCSTRFVCGGVGVIMVVSWRVI